MIFILVILFFVDFSKIEPRLGGKLTSFVISYDVLSNFETTVQFLVQCQVKRMYINAWTKQGPELPF